MSAGATPAPPGLAVVGCGRMGATFHVPALASREDVDLRALVDPRCDEIGRLAARHGVAHTAATVEGLGGLGVSAAVVAVPNHQHATITSALLEAGIDVLVEKPLAPTVEQCRRILAAAHRSGRTASVALPLRTSPAAEFARDAVLRGALGRVREVTVEYGNTWRRPAVTDPRRQRETAGGGVLLDLGSHVLDLLAWWLGELEVTEYNDDAHGGVEADAVVQLEQPEGGRVRVELSWTRDLAQVARLRGEAGTLEVGLGNDRVVWRSNASRQTVRGLAAGPNDARETQGLATMVRRVHDGFLAALRGEPNLAPTLEEGMRSVQLIEQCYARRRPLVWPWASTAPSSGRRPTAPDPMLRGRRVLVTGATGFIGSHVVEELVLRQGAQVRALARPGAAVARLLRLPVDLRWGSITDATAVAKAVAECDLVVHCAHDTGSPVRNALTGVQGTRTVVETARHAGVRRLVHLSSAVVYGETEDGDLDETTPWGPTRNPYSLSKRAGERVVEAGHDRGLDSVILQPMIVYGPWGKRWTTGCIAQMKTGLVPVLDGGMGLCNIVFVDDLVAAILLAATAPAAAGERLLISSAEPVTWREFYAGFESALGYRATMSVPSDALGSVVRMQRRRLRRNLVRGAASGLRQTLSEPDSRTALQTIPLVGLASKLAEDILGRERWGRIKGELVTGTPGARGPDRPVLHVPGANVIAAQQSRTRLRIDRAQRTLGYEPRFDLQDGMAATAAFLHWARLIDGTTV